MSDTAYQWPDDGACKGHTPDLWFPPRGAASTKAKQICNSCPVKTECLTHAMQHGERFGIWGGTTEEERKRLRRWYLALGRTA
jgi:WhiB family redox-sensing transcriptional regulator